MDFVGPVDNRVKVEIWILLENWEIVKHERNSDTNYSWSTWNTS